MLVLDYPTKKVLKTKVGKELEYLETSIFGLEFPGDGTGTVYGSNRPHITGHKREFYAKVTVTDYLITKVE